MFLQEPTLWITIFFVLTGTVNTLSVKWSNKLESAGNGEDAKIEFFRHPHLQTWGMFFGESLCLVVYFARYAINRIRREKNVNQNLKGFVGNIPNQESRGNQAEPRGNIEGVTDSSEQPKFNPLILLPAAMMDLFATSIMYVGLTLTSASSFQMLRGSVIVFTGILSRYEYRQN
jgi:hypothetical protein